MPALLNLFAIKKQGIAWVAYAINQPCSALVHTLPRCAAPAALQVGSHPCAPGLRCQGFPPLSPSTWTAVCLLSAG